MNSSTDVYADDWALLGEDVRRELGHLHDELRRIRDENVRLGALVDTVNAIQRGEQVDDHHAQDEDDDGVDDEVKPDVDEETKEMDWYAMEDDPDIVESD